MKVHDWVAWHFAARAACRLLLAVALNGFAAVACAQLQLGSTTGILPASPLDHSVILGNRLGPLAAQWAAPLTPEQQYWVNNIQSRADAATSGASPASFGQAASDAAVAQSAALRFAMAGQAADLAKTVAALLVADVPTPPANAFIIRPEVLTSYLSAYDFIRGAGPLALPDATRSQIETRLLGLAQSLDDGNNTFSNARAKVGATRALAGVLLDNQPLLDRGLGDLAGHFEYSTTDDGWFTDSQAHYLNYTLRHVGLFARAYEQASGVDVLATVRPYADQALGLRLPDGAQPNVSNGLHVPAAVQVLSLDAAVAAETRWMLEHTSPHPYDWLGTNLANNDETYSSQFALVDFAAPAIAEPSRSPTWFAPGQSQTAVFRQNWGPTSDYLAMSPGIDSPATEFTIGNPPQFVRIPAFHSHNDTGEILLAAHGEYLLVAPGYDRTDLSNSPTGFVPKNPDWHNVVLVDGDLGGNNQGRAMRPEDFTLTNRLDSRELGGFQGAGDFSTLRTSYGGAQVERSMAFPGEDYFVVVDRLTSPDPHTYGFNLVGRGTQTVLSSSADGASVSWTANGATVVEHLLATQPLSLATADRWMHDDFNQFEPTRRMLAQIAGSDALFVSVLDTGGAGDPADLLVERQEGDAEHLLLHVSDTVAGWQDTLFAQWAPVPRAAGDLSTDALYANVRAVDAVPLRLMFSVGTWLDWQGQPLVSSSQAVVLSAVLDGAQVRGTVSDDGLLPGTALRWWGRGRILSAEVDGQAVAIANGPGYGELWLPHGGLVIARFAPVPEPATITLAMFAVGLGCLFTQRSRSRAKRAD